MAPRVLLLAVLGAACGSPKAATDRPGTPAIQPKEVQVGEMEIERVRGTYRIPPDRTVQYAMYMAHEKEVTAKFKLCVDEEGKPQNISRTRSSGYSAYDQQIELAMRGWRFKPMRANGRPVSACATYTFIYHQLEPGDPPPGPARAPILEHADSDHEIPPDAGAGGGEFLGTFEICIDEDGVPTSVKTMRSTGNSAYDDKIVDGMLGWRFKPFLRDGKPIPACSAYTFIYRQKAK
jgi:TonB family protein